MSYLVLARKYRPQSFSDVVGQESIVDTLCKALTSGRIAHAFLFTGSRGIGKTTIARLLAKALACDTGISANPCGTCTQCKQIVEGTSLDVVEIDGASHTSVDNIRDLRETTRYQPASARFKIFIIDEVHMLSTSAFNALLKTLEEPPPHVKFIFATTEAHKIPVTILSRCQRYDFRRISVDQIVKQIQTILVKENLQIDKDALYVIAQTAQGGMRDALSLTDQVLSFTSGHATLQDVTQILGLLDRQEITNAVSAVLLGETQKAIDIASRAYLGGYDLKQLMESIATEIRHLAIAASTGSVNNLSDLPQEELQKIKDNASKADAADLQRLFALALESVDEVASSDLPKLALELAFLRMCDRPPMAEAIAIHEAISRLEGLIEKAPEQNIKPAVREAPRVHTAPAQASAPAPAPIPAPIVSPATVPLSGVDQKWLSFVDAVAKEMPSLGSHLEHGRVVESPGDKNGFLIRVEFKQKLHYQNVVDSRNNENFLSLLRSAYHPKTMIEALLPDGVTAAVKTINEAKVDAAKKAQDELEQTARENPLVQKALSLFGGEIRSVKRVQPPKPTDTDAQI